MRQTLPADSEVPGARPKASGRGASAANSRACGGPLEGWRRAGGGKPAPHNGVSGAPGQTFGAKSQGKRGGWIDILVMTGPAKRKQWMIDDPDLPQSINTEDVLTRLPSGDKVSVSAFIRAAFYFVLEERGQRTDLSPDEFKAWFETEFNDPREFFEWIKDLDADGLEKLGHLALALDHPH
jgi:hypothetical protein